MKLRKEVKVFVFISMVFCIAASVVSGAGLCERWRWDRYKTPNYICTITNTGRAIFLIGESNVDSGFPGCAVLFGGGSELGSQFSTKNIKEISGKKEEIEGGKRYTIKTEYLSGAGFTEYVTCTDKTVRIEYRVKTIPGESGLLCGVIRSENPELDWLSIFEPAKVTYKLRDEENCKDLKALMKKDANGEAIEIKQKIQWLEINPCYGRKVKIEILSDGNTLFRYKNYNRKSLILHLWGGTDDNALISGLSREKYVFEFTFEPLPDMEKLAEETRYRRKILIDAEKKKKEK